MASHKRSRDEVAEGKAFRAVEKENAKAAKVTARRSGTIARGKQRQGDLRKGRDTDR